MAVVVISQCKLPKALFATPELYPVFVVTLQCECSEKLNIVTVRPEAVTQKQPVSMCKSFVARKLAGPALYML
jgi:hypothetical protein